MTLLHSDVTDWRACVGATWLDQVSTASVASTPAPTCAPRQSGQESSVWRAHHEAWLRFCFHSLPRGCTTYGPGQSPAALHSRWNTAPEAVLGVNVPLLGQRPPLVHGCRVVSTEIGILARLKIGQGGHAETDDRQHEGDGESEREGQGSLAGRRILGGERSNYKTGS